MSTKKTYTICSDCAAGIANNDWTHLDFDYDRDERESINDFLSYGEYQILGPSVGEIECECCGTEAIRGSEVEL